MSIRVACPSCSYTDTVPEEAPGKLLKCPQCRVPLIMGSKEPDRPKPTTKGAPVNTVDCPSCRTRFTVDASLAGKMVKCRKCQEPFRVPDLTASKALAEPTEQAVGSNLLSCPDCEKQVSRRASQCPNCGCPLAIEHQSASAQVHAPSISPQREIVYFDDGGVKVTNIRLIVPNQTYAISGINSVSFFKEGPNIIYMILMPLVAFFVALFVISPIIVIVSHQLEIPRELGMAFLALIILGLPSLVFIWSFQRQKPTYGVRLDTSGGRVRAFHSPNQDFIKRIIKAVNDAIIARG